MIKLEIGIHTGRGLSCVDDEQLAELLAQTERRVELATLLYVLYMERQAACWAHVISQVAYTRTDDNKYHQKNQYR